MLLLQAYRIRSAYVFAVLTGTLIIGALGRQASKHYHVEMIAGYAVPLLALVAMGVEAVTTVCLRLLTRLMEDP
jgi:hypothetical protein